MCCIGIVASIFVAVRHALIVRPLLASALEQLIARDI
jgi:hypothetical protein